LAIINRINKIDKPDFVIITGDLTQNGISEEIKYFKACMLKFTMPVFLTPGNHDHGGSGLLPGSIDNYNNYLVPRLDSGGEGDLDDYSFYYGEFHFVFYDSGAVSWQFINHCYSPTTILTGLTAAQLAWMQADVASSAKPHTMIFTHAPSVPDGETAYRNDHSHIDFHDVNFVEWLNSEAGSTVEAVFAGHTHQDHIFYDVSTSRMSAPDDLLKPYNQYGISPMTMATIYFASTTPIPSQGICGSPIYVETDTACKGYS